MTRFILPLAVLASTPVMAQETRQMDAHEHGVSILEVAIEGGRLQMDLHAPGADIVGFEYAAKSDAEKDAIEASILAFTRPADMFKPDAAAECRVAEILTHLHGHEHDEDHEDEGHHGDHEHEEHAEGHDHDKHDHDEHADHEHAHEEGEHDEHAEGHDHDHEAEGAVHSEFHARMIYDCAHPEKLTMLDLPFFAAFPNAQELEIMLATDHGATVIEVPRDQTSVSLEH